MQFYISIYVPRICNKLYWETPDRIDVQLYPQHRDLHTMQNGRDFWVGLFALNDVVLTVTMTSYFSWRRPLVQSLEIRCASKKIDLRLSSRDLMSSNGFLGCFSPSAWAVKKARRKRSLKSQAPSAVSVAADPKDNLRQPAGVCSAQKNSRNGRIWRRDRKV